MSRILLTVGVAAWALAASTGLAGDAKLMAKAYEQGNGALAQLQCKFVQGGMENPVEGLATCVSVQEGIGLFITLALEGNAVPENIRDLTLNVPGGESKPIKAELMGVDALTGIGFVRATEKGSWKPISFVRRANLKIGQEVASVGLFASNAGNVPYVTSGNVGAMTHVPEEIALITSGTLSNIGSPVFAESGDAIGIVGRQQFSDLYTMTTNRGSATVSLKAVRDSSCFMPVEEFADVFARIPSGGRGQRMAWMGVMKLQGVARQLAELAKLDKPGVMLEQIGPGGPADKAALKDRDIVVAVNGKDLRDFASPLLTAKGLMNQLARIGAGKDVALGIVRDGKRFDVTLRLEPAPLMPNEAPSQFVPSLGALVRERIPLDAHLLTGPAATTDGLIVAGVQRDSAASKAGLADGDIVTAVGSQTVTTIQAFNQAIEKLLADPQHPRVVFQVRRGDQVLPISIQPARRP
ncbi:MAG: PDZ domain-containing protein [Planctomycetaceae bacterium]|nr:PDZ domain-containing protein [Planctomycetaceae bacterium]